MNKKQAQWKFFICWWADYRASPKRGNDQGRIKSKQVKINKNISLFIFKSIFKQLQYIFLILKIRYKGFLRGKFGLRGFGKLGTDICLPKAKTRH